MKQILYLLIALPFTLFANAHNKQALDTLQKGIHFEKGLTWSQVLFKAKSEKKFIFVDCYTTWCMPCKKMEQNVYPLESVGNFFNGKFISVKFQMDTTKGDDESLQKLYMDVNKLKREYSVDAFPTYLFFSPDGKLLYRKIGGVEANEFINTASEAINPDKNYYTFLEEYKSGQKDYPKIALMARTALTLKDTINATKLAADYISHLEKAVRFTKNNILFLKDFTKATKEFGFTFFYKFSDTINKVMEDDDYSQDFIQRLIYNEYIANNLSKAEKEKSDPKWLSLQAILKNKFGSYYAERVILSAKPSWFRKQKNGKEYIRYLVLFFDKYKFPATKLFKASDGTLEDLVLNNYAWEVFKYSNERQELIRALTWSNRAVMMNPIPNWIDTNANLLYKLGKTDLAIQWEAIALKLEPNNVDIKQNIETMKNGLPTWPASSN